MATTIKGGARLNIRLSARHKVLLQRAAEHMGQTLTDFATSMLVTSAREILKQESTTELSRRDREIFIKLLDDVDAEPNKTLKKAAQRYTKSLG
jgi:uncharacterized protein (DUF1778 family)